MSKTSIRLRQWQIQRRSGRHCLVGEVVRHPRLIEGEAVISSPLLFVDFRTMTAETLKSVYTLI